MFNSLNTQYLLQAPDYRLFTNKAGCISGCASGISPVLELGQSVLVDHSILEQFKALFCKAFDLLTYRFCNHNWRTRIPEWLSSEREGWRGNLVMSNHAVGGAPDV